MEVPWLSPDGVPGQGSHCLRCQRAGGWVLEHLAHACLCHLCLLCLLRRRDRIEGSADLRRCPHSTCGCQAQSLLIADAHRCCEIKWLSRSRTSHGAFLSFPPGSQGTLGSPWPPVSTTHRSLLTSGPHVITSLIKTQRGFAGL